MNARNTIPKALTCSCCMGSWDVAGLPTSLLIQIGPEGRHNPCRAREGPEWYMKSNRPGGPTQMRTRQMYRHLRGLDLFFVPIPVVNTTGKGCADPPGLKWVGRETNLLNTRPLK